MLATVKEILKNYALNIRNLRRANADMPETALAPQFQQLMKNLLPHLPAAPALEVVPEFNRPGVGRPDIALIQTGAPPRAFVELKASSKSANPESWKQGDKQQFERFQELANWSTCNFYEFRLLARAEQIGQAIVVPEKSLSADKDDKAADKLIEAHDPSQFLKLLELLCANALLIPAAEDAEDLASRLAHASRLVRGIVRDRLPELPPEKDPTKPQHPLNQVRKDFRDVLYAHPEAAGYTERDFDKLFSAAFAQTLAFGMLLVREATGKDVGPSSWQDMPEEHPLMRTALRVLSFEEIVKDVGIGFDVIRDTVNSFDPTILQIGEDGHDPILYFYENFLETFAPEDRERFGVFYTPVEVVRYMTAALNRALRDSLKTNGLQDENVTILDPATGTGTFLLGIAEHVRKEAEPAGLATLALRGLAKRMFAFELLIGPYAVSHYRLHHALKSEEPLPRLGIYLADTLAEPGATSPVGALGFVAQGIQDERHLANELKTNQPILAIIGNPPYRRLEEGENRTLVGVWMDGIWDDLKKPVSDAGWGGQLNTFPELSVAFWRWSLWKLFEANNAPKRGVVAFITNRKFLTGKPYAGLRQMMRRRFDRIEIIDLRGDSRLGERAGIEGDQNVFNIQVGVAITLAIADGSKAEGEEAKVYYSDIWNTKALRRKQKLDWLTSASVNGNVSDWLQIDRKNLANFRPKPFANGEWVGLDECFVFSKSGMKTGDDPTFVTVDRSRLRPQVEAKLSTHTYNSSAERQSIYRPFDKRWFYNDLTLLNRPGPQLQAAWGATNTGLYALPSGTSAGPALWCHWLLPDYHSFRGSYGGYAFPLWDRRNGPDAHNLNPSLLSGLRAAYGKAVEPQQVFDAVLCLLSASSYSLQFAEDLEDVFPHIPFPAQHKVFAEAAQLGAEIRAVETFSRTPCSAFATANLCRFTTPPKGKIIAPQYADGAFDFCENGAGHATGIPAEVWNYSVSGYFVLQRWIAGREGLDVDITLANELRDICGRIAELIDLSAKADKILEQTLKQVLGRAALGFGPSPHE